MQHEEVITCPMTGIELCYKTQVTPEISNYMSLASGFYTNSLMKPGEQFYEEQMESLPELYKDIAWIEDKTGLTWIPNTVNEPGVGMVFVNGTSKDNWGWMAVKAIKIPENERKNHPIPGKKDQFLEYKMDLPNGKMFKVNEYMLALAFIEVI